MAKDPNTIHTLETFRIEFPEFDEVGGPLIQAKLDVAAAMTDATVFKHLTGAYHGHLTAHLLLLAPGGRDARLAKNSHETTYSKTLEELRLAMCGGYGLT